MPQLTWRNPNPFDEWWNVWALVAPRLAASGLEVTKSENTTASGMTVGYRRVIKISDGMYAELLNLQGELAKSGLKFWATQFYNSAVGYQNAEIDSYVSNNPTGVYGPCAFIGLHTLGGETLSTPTEQMLPAIRLLREGDDRFAFRVPELVLAMRAATNSMSVVADFAAEADISGGAKDVYRRSCLDPVLGAPGAAASWPSPGYLTISNGAARLHQFACAGPRVIAKVNAFNDIFRSVNGSADRALMSTTYLRIGTAVDAGGEIVSPTRYVALPLVSSLIIGDGVFMASCTPLAGVPGSGCWVVVSKIDGSAGNGNTTVCDLSILRKSPLVGGSAVNAERAFTAHTVGTLDGRAEPHDMSLWRVNPPIATDYRTGGVVTMYPYLYGEGLASEVRGACDGVQFSQGGIAVGTTAWKGTKRYLCIDQGVMVRIA